MEFKKGVGVFTAKGDQVGTIEQVVVDPRTKEVCCVIVQQGFLFTEDKVLPIDLIAEATDERVTLKEDVGDLEAMPKFEEDHYVRAMPATEPSRESVMGQAWPLYYLPPNKPSDELVVPALAVEGPRYVRQSERNVPEGDVVLEEGVKVFSADGERVGDVAEVFVDEESDRITHLLISRGLLFKEERLVPVSWIDKVWEGEVYLAVESSLLGELHPYTPKERPD
jgi:uncharacterized protein YrrD